MNSAQLQKEIKAAQAELKGFEDDMHKTVIELGPDYLSQLICQAIVSGISQGYKSGFIIGSLITFIITSIIYFLL